MSQNPPIIFKNLSKSYSRVMLFENIDVQLDHGEVILLSGINGAGKTTLMRILAGLEKPNAPKKALVDFGYGNQIWKKSRRSLIQQIMYLHQRPYMFEGSVRRNMSLAVSGRLSRKQRNDQINLALQWGMLEGQSDANAKTLSGGQQQRVALARAWLRRCPCLLLDEPITNMDVDSSTRTIKLLHQLKAAGKTILICSHSNHAFEGLIDRHLELRDKKLHDVGKLIFSGNITSINRDIVLDNAVG